MRHIIYNSTNEEYYIKVFKSGSECRHWIINHLALSLGWWYKTLDIPKCEETIYE